jgi:hypothetical protein
MLGQVLPCQIGRFVLNRLRAVLIAVSDMIVGEGVMSR